jgi:hypothetical protein
MGNQGGGDRERSEAHDRRCADRAVLDALATQLDAWREAHATDDREAAIVVLPRETVELLSRALRRGLNADVHLEKLEARIAQAFLFAKSSPGSEMTRLRRAVRFMWTGINDDEERGGKRRSHLLKFLLAQDYTRMTMLCGKREFPFRNAAARVAGRPALTIVCPLDRYEAILALSELYAFPSPAACLRQLQRVRQYLRGICRSAPEPFFREVATRVLADLPADWGDPPVERA